MTAYFEFLWAALFQFFNGIKEAIFGLLSTVNIFDYLDIAKEFSGDFGAIGWVFTILTLVILVLLIVAIIVIFVIIAVRKINKKRKLKNQAALVEEVGKLSNQVIRLTREKDKILAIKAGAPDLPLYDYGTGAAATDDENESVLKDGESRFYKLTKIDEDYATYDREAEEFNNEITLEEICDQFRNYACSRMGLYYEPRVIRLFLAAFSSTRLIILQGISGTGKTSLPYAWGKFLQNDTQIASVQPSWRDRSELFGYFNEFTKRFSETEVLPIRKKKMKSK